MTKNILILTGAGISADSGVSTFRDEEGIWSKYNLEEVATPEAFAKNPALVHEFYNLRRRGLKGVAPNPAHFALVELEKGLAAQGGSLTLVTQNVDDLHERAGSENMLHMHGELAKIRCEACGNVRHWSEDLSVDHACSTCDNKGFLRPHIVWFGEIPMFMDEIGHALSRADLFVSIGTSGAVYPAAGFVAEARAKGIKTMEINLEPSENAALFDEVMYGSAKEKVPQWVADILQ